MKPLSAALIFGLPIVVLCAFIAMALIDARRHMGPGTPS